jgi:hypothetical protein
MEDRRIPETLEEAYRLRDSAESLQERDFYQEQVYHLRREEYRSRGIRTEISSRRRERQSAIEFSREMFFLEVAEISGRASGRPGGREARAAQHEARRTPPASTPTPSSSSSPLRTRARSSCTGATTWSSSGSASPGRGLLPLAGHRPGGRVRVSPGRGERGGDRLPDAGRLAYAVERAAIQIRDLPGGMILILLTFFASLFAFVWATQTWDSAVRAPSSSSPWALSRPAGLC